MYQARPFYTDSGALAPTSFDSDLEKVDADSGSASGTPPEGAHCIHPAVQCSAHPMTQTCKRIPH